VSLSLSSVFATRHKCSPLVPSLRLFPSAVVVCIRNRQHFLSNGRPLASLFFCRRPRRRTTPTTPTTPTTLLQGHRFYDGGNDRGHTVWAARSSIVVPHSSRCPLSMRFASVLFKSEGIHGLLSLALFFSFLPLFCSTFGTVAHLVRHSCVVRRPEMGLPALSACSSVPRMCV